VREDCECTCAAWVDEQPDPYSFRTCPECLPPGSIEWLIENGRQLDLLEDRGVLEPVRGLESIEKSFDQVTPVSDPGDGLPF